MFGLKCVQPKVESREIISYETTLFYEGMLHIVNQFEYIYISVCYRFPLFTAIHKICIREMDPREFITCLRNHPEHL